MRGLNLALEDMYVQQKKDPQVFSWKLEAFGVGIQHRRKTMICVRNDLLENIIAMWSAWSLYNGCGVVRPPFLKLPVGRLQSSISFFGDRRALTIC